MSADQHPTSDFLVAHTPTRRSLSLFDPFDQQVADQGFLDRVAAAIRVKGEATAERRARWQQFMAMDMARQSDGVLVRIEGRTQMMYEERHPTLDEAVSAILEWFYPEGAE